MTMPKSMLKVIVAAFVAAITVSTIASPQAAAEERIVIEIENFQFVPANPATAVGDVVIWINNDIVPHTVTSKDNSWDSGKIGAGESWETVVTADMVQDYFCRFHPSMTARLDIAPE